MQKVFIIRETVIGSWARDVFSFGVLFAMYWLNYRFLGASVIINITLSFGFYCGLMSLYGRTKNKSHYSIDEAIKELERMRNGR